MDIFWIILQIAGVYGFIGFVVASLEVHSRAVFLEKTTDMNGFSLRFYFWPAFVLYWGYRLVEFVCRGVDRGLKMVLEEWLRWIQFVPRYMNLDGTSKIGSMKALPPARPWSEDWIDQNETILFPNGAPGNRAKVAKSPNLCGCGFGIDESRKKLGKKNCASCQRDIDEALAHRLRPKIKLCTKCDAALGYKNEKKGVDYCDKCQEVTLDELIAELESV